jgi:D-alanyl-D-alanine carboxypeptidase (penicillin-binding protein 5/6)
VLLVAGVCTAQLLRAAPPIEATPTFAASTRLGTPAQLPLPASGSFIIAVEGLGTVDSVAPETRRPIASVTKMMTAHVILKGHPLRPGESGPTLTITNTDVARYLQMVAEDQSSLPVRAGMPLTQYELLQGMLIPSANNFAEVLAVWDAGSVSAFVAKMNAEARALGMANTTYADPSGFLATTTSTAADQLILARAIIKDPVFASIVSMAEARIPGIGLVTNVNQLLGVEGVVGIKTGYTEEAGGNLAFAARRQAGGTSVQVIGIILGQPTRPLAFDTTRRLLANLGASLQTTTAIAEGTSVGSVDSAWSEPVDLVAGEGAQMLALPGMMLNSTLELDPIEAPLAAGTRVGWLTLRIGEQERRVPINLARDLPKPGILWRLTRT